jgi:hypothetical protein
MKTQLLLAFLCLFVARISAECFGGIDPQEVEDPADCDWYDEFCCDAADLEAVAELFEEFVDAAEEECGSIPEGCLDQIHLYFCALCSPDTADFFDLNVGIRVCSDFAEKFYDACKVRCFFSPFDFFFCVLN